MAPMLHSPPANSQYASTSGLTGWAAMAKTVRDFDEEKIRDCKEDIDTLLVFAGLFSAVLTAFLIESYHNLLPPDSSAGNNVEVTGLLREISLNTRGYNTGIGSFNDTVAAPSTVVTATLATAPYSPSPAAIRVNSLWFASLVFSLATASFGMLVKQWLREYLACEYTSPRARLRIRQRRNPGIRIWKVFQIAALLPLLLQLSLALFFVGLCVFTWSINRQVARPTIVFVCAWAFFLVASIILPVFFPDCPYKTTAFLRVTRFLRSYIITLRQHIGHISRNRVPSGRASRLRSVVDAFGTTIFPKEYAEEDVIAQDQKQDVEVLISVDAALTDDAILETTIWEALQQLQLLPHDTLTFLFEVIQHRFPLPSLRPESPHIAQLLDLRSLGFQAWQAITDIAGSVLLHGLESATMPEWTGETKDALLVFLSYSSYTLPARHIPLLQQCFKAQHWPACMGVLTRQASLGGPQAQEQILRCFRSTLSEYPLDVAIMHFGRLIEAVTRGFGTPSPLWQLLADQSGASPGVDVVWRAELDVLSDFATAAIRDRDAPMLQPELASFQTVLFAILNMPAAPSLSMDLRSVFRQLCGQSDGMNSLLSVIAAPLHHVDIDGAIEQASWRMQLVYGTIFDTETRKMFLGSTVSALYSYTVQTADSSQAMIMDYVRLCRVYLTLQLSSHVSNMAQYLPADDALLPHWQELWNIAVLALAKFATTRGHDISAHNDDALHCFALLNSWESWHRPCSTLTSAPAVAPDDDTDGGTEPFPDALFAALSLFVTDHDALRRLDGIRLRLQRSDMLSAVPERRMHHVPGGKTIWAYLKDAGFQLDHLFPRLLVTLSAYVPTLQMDKNAGDLPDLTTLSEHAWTLVSEWAAAVIMQGLPLDLDTSPGVQPTESMNHALLLLLSRSPYDIPAQGVRAVAACLHKSTWRGATQGAIADYAYSAKPENIVHVLHRVRPAIAQVTDLMTASHVVLSLAQCVFHRFSAGERCPHGTVWNCLWEHRGLSSDEFWLAIRTTYRDLIRDLVQKSPTEAANEAFAVFDYANCCRIPAVAIPEFHNTLHQLLLHPNNPAAASQIYRPVVALTKEMRKPTFATISGGIRTVYGVADDALRHQLVRVFGTVPKDHNTRIARLDEAFNHIRVLLLHLEIYKVHCPFDADSEPSLPTSRLKKAWDELWMMTVVSLRKFVKEKELDRDEQCELALEGFALLDKFEDRIQRAPLNKHHLTPDALANTGAAPSHSNDEVPFPGDLYVALGAFVLKEEVTRLDRFEHVRRRLSPSHMRPISRATVREGSADAVIAGRDDLLGIHPMSKFVQAGPSLRGVAIEGSETREDVDAHAEGGETSASKGRAQIGESKDSTITETRKHTRDDTYEDMERRVTYETGGELVDETIDESREETSGVNVHETSEETSGIASAA